ncbi:uncharacterized protein [Lepeophtheirus salmonis]|uniref:uncharacterized protein n=1 Tax=Lepeophtheirus salmonis TaxID=72036 RepID=UPI001AEAE5B3|nr:uncharacterized protein LOC121120126 [Lepeophtheirus salmonis]
MSSLTDEEDSKRTKSVNGAFAYLRGLIPTEPLDRKLSKIETLRLATSYIEHLATQLNNEMANDTPCLVPSSNRDRRSVCTFCLGKVKAKSIAKNIHDTSSILVPQAPINNNNLVSQVSSHYGHRGYYDNDYHHHHNYTDPSQADSTSHTHHQAAHHHYSIHQSTIY